MKIKTQYRVSLCVSEYVGIYGVIIESKRIWQYDKPHFPFILSRGTYYTSHYATDWPDFIYKAFCEGHHPFTPRKREKTEIGLKLL